MKNVLLGLVITFFMTIIGGKISIPLLKRAKAGQTILKYVKEHQGKNGTPTMGGLFFVIPVILVSVLFIGVSIKIVNVTLAIGFSFLVVGFLDDFIKIKTKENQGLKAYQKIIFQTSIAISIGVYIFLYGNTNFYIPFTKRTIDLKWFSVPLVAFVFIAITNSVNLTDGLDGLASCVSLVYLIFISVIICLQKGLFISQYFLEDEYGLVVISSCLIGGLLGFLTFNVSKASVFMGDTGSLALGGFIGSVSVFSGNSLLIPVLGITFVFSAFSVIIQVVYFKKTKKRVFLMTPIHHHFQLKGYSESKISYLYSIVTCIIGVGLVIFYL